MPLDPAFQKELARIDALLAPRVGAARARLSEEIAALRDRLEIARAVGLTDLATEIALQLGERERAFARVSAFGGTGDGGQGTGVRRETPPASQPTNQRTNVLPPDRPTAQPPAPNHRTTEPPPPPNRPTAQPPRITVSPLPDFAVALAESVPEPAGPTKEEKRALRKETDAFLARERAFYAGRGWNPAREAEIKHLVLTARALIERGREMGMDDGTVERSLDLLRREFHDLSEGQPFFALNGGRVHRPALWRELAGAYEILGHAEAALDWVERENPAAEDRDEILSRAAAAEAWIHRLADEHGLGFTDAQQRRVHARVEGLLNGRPAPPWWGPLAKTEAVAKEARPLARRLEEIRAKHANAQGKADAMTALEEAVASLNADGDLEETLVPAVKRCLEAGVPPSNKRLVSLCLPFRATFRESDDRTFARFLEFLQKEETLLARKGAAEAETDVAAPLLEPEFARKLAEVQNLLRGKTVLFVGGRRQRERIEDYERELGIKLEWPDADPDSLMRDFLPKAERADVVCYLIRWSRHSYKKVVDHARAHGKATMTIKAGIGVNRFILDAYHQLIERPVAV